MRRDLDREELRRLSCGVLGVSDAPCPICGPERRAAINQKRKVLRIWDEGDFITYNCARCGTSGWARSGGSQSVVSPPRAPTPAQPDPERIELAQALWRRSVPLRGSLAESYLRTRACLIDTPNVRFLPPRGDHHPAMIARFGEGDLTGIHITRLNPDGTGKAGTDKDKLMIGPSTGQPIVVHDNPDHGDLIVAEGIEDAASLALSTGWTAWAAGAAVRIPTVVARASTGEMAIRFDRVFVAVDADRAGQAALAGAKGARPDAIPIHFPKVLQLRGRLDANEALRRYGPDVVMAAIEWCEAQARAARGEIGFHAMLNAVAHAESIFRKLVPAT